MQLKKGFCFCPECLHLLPEDKAQGDRTTYSTVKPSIPLRQEELILLQEQVKKGILSVDEALEKFKEWQNHRSGLEATQQEKIRQLRDSIIRKRPEEESTYGKLHLTSISISCRRELYIYIFSRPE
uniref:Uncharacterized protein n=1 Tax=Podarcis muralis TaxID=64176 RepID=A0A670IZB3_PODMU